MPLMVAIGIEARHEDTGKARYQSGEDGNGRGGALGAGFVVLWVCCEVIDTGRVVGMVDGGDGSDVGEGGEGAADNEEWF